MCSVCVVCDSGPILREVECGPDLIGSRRLEALCDLHELVIACIGRSVRCDLNLTVIPLGGGAAAPAAQPTATSRAAHRGHPQAPRPPGVCVGFFEEGGSLG